MAYNSYCYIRYLVFNFNCNWNMKTTDNYALRLLKNELRIIKNALSNWEDDKYKEAKEKRQIIIKELEEAINLIEQR